MRAALKPGGRLVVEDIDYSGSFCHPESPVFRRSNEIYTRTAQLNGGDPFIGVRLPRLLLDAGFERVQPSIAHPAALEGDTKLLAPLTTENIKAMAVKHGVATAEEVDVVVDGLYALARDPSVLVAIPRIVQAWGTLAVEEGAPSACQRNAPCSTRTGAGLPSTGPAALPTTGGAHSSSSAASSHSDSTASRWLEITSSWAARSANRS